MKIRLLSILCILLMSLGIQAQTAEFETAAEAVKNMKVGWNYAFALDGTGAEEEYAKTWESAWVWGKENAASMIKMLRKAGFNAIRVPVSWRCFMDDEGKVDPKWMKHVRECVDFVIDQGMYCIINTHLDAAHQGHWLVADEDVYNNVKGRFEYLWIQIAEEFKDYDHHLLFEGYNEMLDKYGSWCFPSLSAPNGYDEDYARSAYDALTKYEQSFVNAVRSTGGNNEKRNLVLNTYAGTIGAHWDWSEHLMDPLIEMKLPTDKAKNHLIIGVHAYYDVNEYYWAKEDVDQAINDIKTYLIPKGVPVIIGEWGSGAGEDLFYKYPKSVLRFVQYFMEQMKANDDIAAFLWTGPVTQNNYANLPAFIEKEFIEALTKGYYRETYEPELLLADDYDVWIPFTPDNQYCWVWLSGIETGGNSGMQVELEEYPGDSKLSICFVCDKGDIYQPITSASSYFDFSTSIYGYEVRGVLLKYNGDTPCDIKIKRFVIDYKDGNKRSFNVAPDIGRHNPKEWSGPNFESKRKQFVHTVEYDGIWAELNIFSDDIPLKLKNYKGIRVEFAEPINVDDFIIKVYADNGAIAEGRAPNSSISTTLLFSDFNVNDVINRVTLQYCKEGKAKTKVVSAWLIRQDGTEEYSDLSPFWGCEIKEKTPYKAAASKEPVYNTFDRYLGGDLSLLPRFEKEGKTYLDDQGNKVEDVLRFLKEEKQFNSIRVRLFVDPSYAPEEHREWGAIQDMEMVKALGKRIKDLGMAFMLDFHYSDTWADPGKQYIPHAWEGLSDEELYVKIYEYTKNSLRELIDAGATPDMIQIGNEVDHGMLWGEYVDRGSSDYSWNRFIRLLKEASKACREVCPQAKIIIHNGCAGVDDLQYFSEKVKEVDYDIVGLSFYLTWDSFDNLRSAFDMFEREFREKDVMVVETNQAYKGEDDYYGYPNTEDGQNNYLNDLIKMLWEYPQVKGLYWWLPEGFRQGLWSEETGKPLAALSTMATFLTQQTEQASNVTGQYLVNPSFDSDLHGWTNTGGTAKWREHVWEALNNFCEFEWTGSAIANQKVVQTITLPAGSYRLSVTCASDPGSSGLYLIAGSYSKEMPGTG